MNGWGIKFDPGSMVVVLIKLDQLGIDWSPDHCLVV
jgi:hypothetical protein